MTGENPLHGYRQLTATAAEPLGLDAEIEMVLAQDWGMEPEPGTLTIYCPPYREEDGHVLLHYLAHGTMLENGWKQPIFRVTDDTGFLIANRSADAFTDFWAYQLVSETFGEEHLLHYTAWIADTDASSLAQDLIEKQHRHGFTDEQFSRYCVAFTLDWFAMAPELLRPAYPDRATLLLERCDALKQTAFVEHAPQDVDDRLETVREQYRELQREHGSYSSLLGVMQETAFKAYYDAAWPAYQPVTVEGFTNPLKNGEI